MTCAFPLTPSQIEGFEQRGYLVVEGVFSAREVARMRDAFDQLEQTARTLRETTTHEGSQFVVESNNDNDDEVRIHRVVWCGAAAPVLGEFGKDPRLVHIGAQLLGSPRLEQLINQAHFKFPGDQVAFEWHQDSKHRRYGTDLWTDVNGTGSFIETATAIDPMTSQNGPLQFIPRSHHHGHIPPDPDTKTLPEASFDPGDAVAMTMQPGSVVVFGPYVIHGSQPNRGMSSRRLFLNGFAYPGANRRDYPGDDSGRVVDASER
jgi:ectoine hydroxylase-related dioxygenase (phytanoyl-CoA dioxygenase family)